MLRVRFKANPDDPRPVNWPVPHPYWVTGQAGDGSYSTVVSYADSVDYITQNWPEATDIDAEEVSGYVFSGRFPKPDWFTSESAAQPQHQGDGATEPADETTSA